MALLSRDYRQEALTISNTMTYVNLSSSPRFMDEFIKAQFLPHTEMRLFPSVPVNNGSSGAKPYGKKKPGASIHR
jgi:uncharacterized 2Fe-2S/4Fe-4S cluster protein (DUF4445 family)